MQFTRRLLIVLSLLFFTPNAFGQEQPPEIFVYGKALKFQSLEKAEVIALDEHGTHYAVLLSKLSTADLKSVMTYSGWGRIWEDSSGKYRVVADFVKLDDDQVVLEKRDGIRIKVPFARLSKADKKYADARRKTGSLPDTFVAKVVGVTDGDTVTVLLHDQQCKIRLSGIDAPEKGQAFGKKAKSHLSKLVFGKFVMGQCEGRGKYGRNICALSVGGKRVDHEMLSTGLAWHYLKFSDDADRTRLENEAKAKRLNVWSESKPVEPWEWRKWGSAKRKAWLAEKSKGVTVVLSRPPPSNQGIAGASSSKERQSYRRSPASGSGHWLNTDTGVRHNPSCRWYRNTQYGRSCSGADGKGCKICGG